MPLSTKTIKTAIHKALSEKGFIITFEGTDGYYLIKNNNKTISLQLVISNSVDINRQCHKSNEVYSINYFKLSIPVGQEYPDFFILAVESAANDHPEFIIIPSATLNKKLFDMGLSWKRNVSLSFLVYPDGTVFNITNISFEGRWYLLTKGVNGRMADGSIFDYTEWLNNWNQLKRDPI